MEGHKVINFKLKDLKMVRDIQHCACGNWILDLVEFSKFDSLLFAFVRSTFLQSLFDFGVNIKRYVLLYSNISPRV